MIHYRGYVSVEYLALAGKAETPFQVKFLKGYSESSWKELLARAAGLGLLAVPFSKRFFVTDPGSYYQVHPLLPFVLRQHLDLHYSADQQRALAIAAMHLVASAGRSASIEYHEGTQRDLSIRWLVTEEQNLLHALLMARRQRYWRATGGLLQGLATLYEPADECRSGRRWLRPPRTTS